MQLGKKIDKVKKHTQIYSRRAPRIEQYKLPFHMLSLSSSLGSFVNNFFIKNRPYPVYQSSLRYFEISGKIPIRNTNTFGRER
jgi:hypothetical protein